MEAEKIVFTTDDGEEILLTVIEETRISGVNYLLVSESEDEDAECVILRDTSSESDTEASYEIVEDDDTLEAVAGVFRELLED
ncbi:MAG: DUF1292 domain-containing protein [Lachnospiraceae bacterium]|nr:DUF1292 domain-containing protein [Lachnospiraceae bacterium]